MPSMIPTLMMTLDLQKTDPQNVIIRQTCLRLLAMREHSAQELRHKLQYRGFDTDLIERVLLEMHDSGWQDNERFAENYARQRILKGYGPLKIRYELQQRGITDFPLDDLAKQLLGGWSASLHEVYAQKFKHESSLSRQEWL